MSHSNKNVQWIAVDWGTTNLRAWAMGEENKILHHATSEKGMSALGKDEFEPALIEMTQAWLSSDQTMPVIACGMVGSRQGWVEAPYQTIPCPPLLADRLVNANALDERLSVWVVPGIKQYQPADVMRGEETQIKGYLAGNPKFEGILCLPGTHTKWVRISAGEIVYFQTFMTGEIFNLLSNQSVLRHTISDDGWDEGAFEQAVADAISIPGEIAAKLFSLRAEALIHGLGADSALAKLSGLLIGVELAVTRKLWADQNVGIIGASKLAQIYSTALSLQGTKAKLSDAGQMVLSGLSAAHLQISEAVS